MNVINKENLGELQRTIREMMGMVEAESHEKSPYFYSFLRVMKNNIQICIDNQCGGIDELIKYLYEDWRMVCNEEKGIPNWKIKRDDCDEMAKINRSFEQKVIQIDELLQTNLFVRKQWLDTSIIRQMGEDFRSNTRYWDEMKQMMIKEGVLTKTKVDGISDDIWSMGKRCGVASSDDELTRWFQIVIPAFNNARPVDIVKMPNGEDALRALMMTIPC